MPPTRLRLLHPLIIVTPGPLLGGTPATIDFDAWGYTLQSKIAFGFLTQKSYSAANPIWGLEGKHDLT